MTLSRAITAPIWLLAPQSNELLLAITIVACLTDFLDGQIARRFKAASVLGAKLDQVCDKAFHISFLLFYSLLAHVSWLFFALFSVRELLVLVGRGTKRVTSSSNKIGKLKSFLTYFLILLIAGLRALNVEIDQRIEVLVVLLEISILSAGFFSMYLSIQFTK